MLSQYQSNPNRTTGSGLGLKLLTGGIAFLNGNLQNITLYFPNGLIFKARFNNACHDFTDKTIGMYFIQNNIHYWPPRTPHHFGLLQHSIHGPGHYWVTMTS